MWPLDLAHAYTTIKVGTLGSLSNWRRRRLRKRHLKSEVALLQTLTRLFHLVNVMHVQSCCFANLNLLLFCRIGDGDGSENVIFKINWRL